MGATYLAARLAVFLSGAVQLILFAAVMLVAAFFMIRQRSPVIPEGEDTNRAMPLLPIILVANGVGAVTGLVGVGGGFLIIPALVLLVGVPMKQAIGTSLLVIAMNSAAGFAGYVGRSSFRGFSWVSSRPSQPREFSPERTWFDSYPRRH